MVSSVAVDLAAPAAIGSGAPAPTSVRTAPTTALPGFHRETPAPSPLDPRPALPARYRLGAARGDRLAAADRARAARRRRDLRRDGAAPGARLRPRLRRPTGRGPSGTRGGSSRSSCSARAQASPTRSRCSTRCSRPRSPLRPHWGAWSRTCWRSSPASSCCERRWCAPSGGSGGGARHPAHLRRHRHRRPRSPGG